MDSVIDPNLLISNASPPYRPDRGGKAADPAKLKAMAQEFEAIFVHSMLKSMRASVPDSGLLEGGSQRQIFQDLMDMELARQTAQHNPTAITEGLLRQLSSQSSTQKKKSSDFAPDSPRDPDTLFPGVVSGTKTTK